MPVVAYAISALYLGPAAIFVPAVVMAAPLGIIWCFKQTHVDPYGNWSVFVGIATHAVFWPLLLYGAVFCHAMPLARLRTIWWFLAALLLMTLSGCGSHLGMSYWQSGNWH
jgi:hypothetical protein